MSMSEDQYLKLFKYMQNEFKQNSESIEEVKGMIRGLQSSVDAYAKQVLDVTQEHLNIL
jgi:phage-related minor tail protein